MRHEDRRQRAAARQAQGRRAPRRARGDGLGRPEPGVARDLASAYGSVPARLAQLAEHRLVSRRLSRFESRARALERAASSPGATASGRSSSAPGRSRDSPRSSPRTAGTRYELLTTRAGAGRRAARARRGRGRLPPRRRPGRCNEVAAPIIDDVGARDLVALGGGRVIDVAKAIAAVRGGRVAAMPTTLSGRRDDPHPPPAGGPRRPPRPGPARARARRPAGDDRACPSERLRASAMNALAHGADSLYTPLANPVSTLAALRGAELIAAALDQRPGRARPRAAGARLAALRLRARLGAVRAPPRVCQTLVRVLRTPARGDQRGDPAARDGGDASPRAGKQIDRARRGARHERGTGSASGSRSSAAGRGRLARPRRRREPARRGARRDPRRGPSSS